MKTADVTLEFSPETEKTMKRLPALLFLSLAFCLAPHPAGSQDVDDAAIVARVTRAIEQADVLEGADIAVTSVNGYVLLTGQTLNADQKQEASKAVAFATNAMRRLINELEVVEAMDHGFADSDADLLRRINERIEYLARDTTVVVHNGTVHLLGRVERAEADAAGSAISRIAGVKSIRLSYEFID